MMLLTCLTGCNEHSKGMSVHAGRVVLIQPLGEFSPHDLDKVQVGIKKLFPQVLVKAAIPLPRMAWYEPRQRYRADSLIRYLIQFGNADTVVIGMTHHDISTTKGAIKDWGVMGLGFSPGHACVVSTFRLSRVNRSEQFYKVAIHELGHTQGLSHCPERTCFMRDAEGGNPLDEEYDFCTSCKSFLISKGWQLP